MAIFDTISLAFQFLPRLPAIERGAAKLRDDEGFLDLIARVPELHDTVTRLSADPDVQAMIQVGKDLFKALAIDGGSTRASMQVAQILITQGAPRDQVAQAFSADPATGNTDAFHSGSDNANI